MTSTLMMFHDSPYPEETPVPSSGDIINVNNNDDDDVSYTMPADCQFVNKPLNYDN
jgi:hypothetical protein